MGPIIERREKSLRRRLIGTRTRAEGFGPPSAFDGEAPVCPNVFTTAPPLLEDVVPTAFWNQLDALIDTSDLTIDRPKGSLHPRRPSIVYPLDYGYLSNTSGGDGDEIDVWRESRPDDVLDAVICTTDLHKRDTEVKLLIGCSLEERQIICEFHETHGMGVILIERRS